MLAVFCWLIFIRLTAGQQYLVRTFNKPGASFFSVATNGDDVFGGSVDSVVHWKLSNSSYELTYPAFDSINGLAATKTMMFAGQFSQSILIYNIGNIQPIRSYPFSGRGILSMTMSGNYLFTGHCNNGDFSVRRWNIETGGMQIFGSHNENVDGLAVNGEFLFSGSFDQTIKQWRISDGGLIQTFTGSLPVYGVASVGDYMFSSTYGPIYKWSVSKGSLLAVYSGHEMNIWALHASGDYLYSGSDDALIKQWQISTDQLVRILNGHSQSIGKLALSGPYLFSAASDGTVKQWLIPELPQFTTLTKTVTPVASKTTVNQPLFVAQTIYNATISATATRTLADVITVNMPANTVQQTIHETATSVLTSTRSIAVTQTTIMPVWTVKTETIVLTTIV